VTLAKTSMGNTSLYAGGPFEVAVRCDGGTRETVQFAPTGTQMVTVTVQQAKRSLSERAKRFTHKVAHGFMHKFCGQVETRCDP